MVELLRNSFIYSPPVEGCPQGGVVKKRRNNLCSKKL